MPTRRTTKRSSPIARDSTIVRAIEAWFAANARDLPWRRATSHVEGVPRRDPYHSLVSELMLQQTQVSRVVDRFSQFIQRFPRVEDLARASEEEVLALWSGLGYYRRARLLHAAARAIVSIHGSAFPDNSETLRALPGIGRYTAGAVASMALGQRTPVVDGNVTRVLLRVEGGRGIPEGAARTGDKAAESWAWSRATQLVSLAEQPGRLNEGLMELGALVCTPSSPQCHTCPLTGICIARAEGTQDSIPAAKLAPRRKTLFCASIIIHDAAGRLAVERRPAHGMWAGLWQAPTLERPDRAPTAAEIHAWLHDGTSEPKRKAQRGLSRLHSFTHTTTHRDVRFEVWVWTGPPLSNASWVWLQEPRILNLALSSVQKRILTSAADTSPAPVG